MSPAPLLSHSLYLRATEIIDFHHPTIAALCRDLAVGDPSPTEYTTKAFCFVRDQIQHSWDYRRNPVTCNASEVLQEKTGFCYAKAHLLAALLRAQGIPAGFCYQRLSLEGNGPPYCLHGLNAVFLPEHGWYRIDARGNREDVHAAFSPPVEQLAFQTTERLERDLPEIWPDPLPQVVEALNRYPTTEELYQNLPDIELLPGAQEQSAGIVAEEAGR